MTYPVIGQMSTHLIGDSTDAYLFVWGNWWTREVLQKGLDIYHTDYIFYPSGVSLYFHAFSHFNALIWLPLASILGDIPAYNLLFLLSYWLASFNMYLLARDLGISGAAAFIAGFIYGFSPYHLSKADNLILCSTQWIPLFVLFFLRGVQRQDLRSSVFAAIFLALSVLSNWHFVTLLGLWTALFLLYTLVFKRRMWTRRAVCSLLVMAVCSGLILAPFLLPLIREMATSNTPYVGQSAGQGNDLLAFFVPGPGHPLWEKLLHPLYARLQMLPGAGRRPPAYLGLIVLGLGVLAAIKKRCQAGFWLVTGIVFAVLSLHSPLTINGVTFDALRLPWFQPLTSLLRASWRFNDLFAFSFAILAALGWDLIRVGLRASHSATAFTCATGALCALLSFAYAKLPFPMIEIQISPFYQLLAQDEGEFAIVNVPMGYSRAKRYMFFQMYHGKKLIGGHVSRPPKDAENFIDIMPILRAIDKGGKPPDRAAFGVRGQLEELAAHDIRYLILHPDQLSDERLALWKAYLAVPPIYEDPVVYDTTSDFTPRWRTSDDLVILDAEWVPGDISQAGWGELSVTWLADRPPERDLDMRASFVDDEGQVTQRESFRIGDEDWPTSKWPVGAAATYAYPVQIGPFIQPGEYALVLELVDSVSGQMHGEPVTIGRIEVAALPRVFVPPTTMHALSADFGDSLALLGYNIKPGDEVLRLTLHWQAQKRMDVFYKFFVHLYGVDSGVLVTQTDVVPRDWTYPTTWWEAGEVVSDEILLPLKEVPPGQYQLAVGVYDAESGERLLVIDAAGEESPDGRLVLPEEITR
jgi:hypothetical protein